MPIWRPSTPFRQPPWQPQPLRKILVVGVPGATTGSAALTLQGLTAAAAGWTTVSGTAALSLPPPSLVVSGTSSTVISGTAALTLAPLSVVVNGFTNVTSNIALVLQRLLVNAAGTGSGTLPQHYYSTVFPLTENPMSESGVWIQGLADGLDWTNIRTTPAKAFATENPALHLFDDSIAVLRGTFGPDQIASATVFDTLSTGDYSAEVEILLRFNIGAHNAHGYEINWSANPSNPYCTIVRWDGAVGSFTTLSTTFPGAVGAGDVVMGKIVGSTITAYKNGAQVNTATDSTFISGNPGIGAFALNATQVADPTLYGLSSYVTETMPVGTAPIILHPLSVSASGLAFLSGGTAALVLQPLVLAATGQVVNTNGTVALLLSPFSVAASGQVLLISGAVALGLQTPTVAATGVITIASVSGSAALSLQTPTVAAVGTSSAPVGGTASLALRQFSVLAIGWTTVTGVAALGLQAPVVAIQSTASTPIPPEPQPPKPGPTPTPPLRPSSPNGAPALGRLTPSGAPPLVPVP